MKKTRCLFYLIFGIFFSCVAQKNTPIYNSVSAPTVNDTLYTNAEFPGGLGELLKYMHNNREYANKKDEKNGIGNISISFVIEKDGSIADSTIVVNTPNAGFYGQESIRLVKSMPRWIPAKVDGKTVRIKFVMPIRF